MTLEEALAQAKSGDVETMVMLANFYSEQSSYQNDSKILFEKALPWYDKAATHGHEFSKEMAARIHFLHAYAKRKALGSSRVQADYEEEIDHAITLIQSMEQPNADTLQEILEDMAIFCCEMSMQLAETPSNGRYIHKTIEYMLPYITSYKRKEALEALVLTLTLFTPEELHKNKYVELFMKSAIN